MFWLGKRRTVQVLYCIVLYCTVLVHASQISRSPPFILYLLFNFPNKHFLLKTSVSIHTARFLALISQALVNVLHFQYPRILPNKNISIYKLCTREACLYILNRDSDTKDLHRNQKRKRLLDLPVPFNGCIVLYIYTFSCATI